MIAHRNFGVLHVLNWTVAVAVSYPLVATGANVAALVAATWSGVTPAPYLAKWRVRKIADKLNMHSRSSSKLKMSQNACRSAKLLVRLVSVLLVGKLVVNPGELLLVVVFTKVRFVGPAL